MRWSNLDVCRFINAIEIVNKLYIVYRNCICISTNYICIQIVYCICINQNSLNFTHLCSVMLRFSALFFCHGTLRHLLGDQSSQASSAGADCAFVVLKLLFRVSLLKFVRFLIQKSPKNRGNFICSCKTNRSRRV